MRVVIAGSFAASVVRRVMAGGALAAVCTVGLPGIAGQPAGAAPAARGAAGVAGPARFVRCGAGALAEAIAAGG